MGRKATHKRNCVERDQKSPHLFSEGRWMDGGRGRELRKYFLEEMENKTQKTCSLLKVPDYLSLGKNQQETRILGLELVRIYLFLQYFSMQGMIPRAGAQPSPRQV